MRIPSKILTAAGSIVLIGAMSAQTAFADTPSMGEQVDAAVAAVNTAQAAVNSPNIGAGASQESNENVVNNAAIGVDQASAALNVAVANGTDPAAIQSALDALAVAGSQLPPRFSPTGGGATRLSAGP